MNQVPKDEFLKSLKECDVCLFKGRTFFAKLQYMGAKKEGIDDKASHSAMIKKAPHILHEANGFKVVGDKDLTDYFSKHHKIYFFRYTRLNNNQRYQILNGMGLLEEGTHYSWGGIWEKAKEFFANLRGKDYLPKDKSGVFCSEDTSDLIRTPIPEIPYLDEQDFPSHQISPSKQLDWMLNEYHGWKLVAVYDKGLFYLS